MMCPGPDRRHAGEAGVELSQGKTLVGILEAVGVSEVTYYRWRQEYGRMTVAQARGA